jgi:hypothetical protein
MKNTTRLLSGTLIIAVLFGLLTMVNTVHAEIGYAESPLFALNTLWTNTGYGVSPPFSLNTHWTNTGFGESDLFTLNTVWTNTGYGESDLFALNTIWTSIGYAVSPLFTMNTFSLPDAPEHLVIRWLPEAMKLHWNRVADTGMLYGVYSDSTTDGMFSTLLATSTDTSYVDSTALSNPMRYYIVRSMRQLPAAVSQKQIQPSASK